MSILSSIVGGMETGQPGPTNLVARIAEIQVDVGICPSPVEVEATWRKIIDEAGRADWILAGIAARLNRLKTWRGKGIVTDDEMEQSESWLKHKRAILNYLIRGRWDSTFWEDTWIDGAGI